MSTTTERTLPPVVHFPWCEQSGCYRDDDGFSEAGIVHVSRELVWSYGEHEAAVHVVRFRADWSEDVTERTMVCDLPVSLTLDQAHQFASWLGDAVYTLTKDTFPTPQATTCPPWCTAATSDDPAVRTDHDWRYSGYSFDSGKYLRCHHGIIGRSWRNQYEYSDEDGTPRLGHVSQAGRVRG